MYIIKRSNVYETSRSFSFYAFCLVCMHFNIYVIFKSAVNGVISKCFFTKMPIFIVLVTENQELQDILLDPRDVGQNLCRQYCLRYGQNKKKYECDSK